MRVLTGKLSGSLMLLIVICFFLPFMAISCDHKQVTRLTGIQLAMGTKLQQESLLWLEKDVPPQPWAALSFGLALAGAGLGFWGKGRITIFLQTLVCMAGAVSLFLLKVKLNQVMAHYPKLFFYVEYLPGYWTAMGMFLVVAAFNSLSILIQKILLRKT